MDKKEHKQSRRDFLKKAAYVAPVVLTIKAAPALAGFGSGRTCQTDQVYRSGSNHQD